jgi:prevent-host-death family protein
MKHVNASHARKTFAGLLEAVVRGGSPVVIVRYRDPIAAIVPISRLSPAERESSKLTARKRRR